MNKTPIRIGYFFVLGIFAVMVRIFVFGIEPRIYIFDRNLFDQIILVWGFISCLGLWLWMLADFFRKGVATKKATWGFSLMLGAYAAAVVYFFLVYIPRAKQSTPEK